MEYANYTKLSDTISAQEGTATITIDGKNKELFEISSLRAQLDMVVQERRMLGHRMMQHKVTGVIGSGSATLYFMNSKQLQMAADYIKLGTRNKVDVTVRNEDPQSTIGAQDVTLTNVIFNTIPVAAIEESDDPITFDTDFTFDDIIINHSFDLPENYR
jgi:hypothetical protein